MLRGVSLGSHALGFVLQSLGLGMTELGTYEGLVARDLSRLHFLQYWIIVHEYVACVLIFDIVDQRIKQLKLSRTTP